MVVGPNESVTQSLTHPVAHSPAVRNMLGSCQYRVINSPVGPFEFMHSLKLPIHIYNQLLGSDDVEIELPTAAAEGSICVHGDRIASVACTATINDTVSYVIDNNVKSLVFYGQLEKKLHAVGDVDALASELRTKTKRKEQERNESKTKSMNKPMDATVGSEGVAAANDTSIKPKRKEKNESNKMKTTNNNDHIKETDFILRPNEQAVSSATKKARTEAINNSNTSKPLHAATNPWLVMRSMPNHATFHQIKYFFSGLTVVTIYASVSLVQADSMANISKEIDIYIEFESATGASLGYHRNDECISLAAASVPVTLQGISNAEAFWAKGTCFNMGKINSLSSILVGKIPACINQIISLGPALLAQKWLFIENSCAVHPDSILGQSISNRAKTDLKLCKMEPYFHNSTALSASYKHRSSKQLLVHEDEHVAAIDTIIHQTMDVLQQVTLDHSSCLLDSLREIHGVDDDQWRVKTSEDASDRRVGASDWMEMLGRIKELYEIVYILLVKQRDNHVFRVTNSS